MAQHHLHTFPNTKAFTDAYNEGTFGVPYVAVIQDITDGKDAQGHDKPLVLYSNRLPYKEGEIQAPKTLSHRTIIGQGVIGASRLG